MDGTQSAKGMRGAFIVKKRPEDDPWTGMYDEEKLVVLSDEWQDPDVCLKLEGAMAGNDVCSDIDFASVNGQMATGQYQDFDKKYPYPLIEVDPGKCYRMRIMMMASNAENYIVSMAGHSMKLIALDGEDVVPIDISEINMHIGERADVIVCADQKPGYYPIEMHYDYACTSRLSLSLSPSLVCVCGFTN
jgi:FtsP/CotA-like multicopper oxidase with cupredoxin domain